MLWRLEVEAGAALYLWEGMQQLGPMAMRIRADGDTTS
jgi:hypothetical protein